MLMIIMRGKKKKLKDMALSCQTQREIWMFVDQFWNVQYCLVLWIFYFFSIATASSHQSLKLYFRLSILKILAIQCLASRQQSRANHPRKVIRHCSLSLSSILIIFELIAQLKVGGQRMEYLKCNLCFLGGKKIKKGKVRNWTLVLPLDTTNIISSFT